MSRTTLCVLTAAGLAAASVGLMACRHHILGVEVKAPNRPGAWKVTLLVRGRTTAPGARLMTLAPLDCGRQHVQGETFRSAALAGKPLESRHPERRQVLWTPRPGVPPSAVQASYQFYCVVDVRRPSAAMESLAKKLYAAPGAGAYLGVEGDREEVSDLARRLTEGLDDPADQAEALFRFVDAKIQNEPSIGGVAIRAEECLRQSGADAGGKSRLLSALLRARGIPARLVTGLTLARGPKQPAHYWVEAWVRGHWLPMCPFFHHYGRVPPTFLVFGFGDLELVRGRRLRDLDHAFLVERRAPDPPAAFEPSAARRLLLALSFHGLPPAEQRLVEFLLLLPVAALIVCVFRHVIGLNSFGTFAPALIGLAFRDLRSWPGLLLFAVIVLTGWLVRRGLDRFHLLQVPRRAFLLSLVVIVLAGGVVVANGRAAPPAPTEYVALFPLVILTGMIERFWTLEAEDGTATSFRTLLGTLAMAAVIGLVAGLHAVARHVYRYPETLGLVMAGQLLLGRYTGYKLSELFRFRDLLRTADV